MKTTKIFELKNDSGEQNLRAENKSSFKWLKRSLLICLILVSSGLVQAQEYRTGLGLRGGFSSGLTIKHFVSGSNAIEGILGTHYRGFLLTGLYEKHTGAFDVSGMKWFYGGGVHLGVYDGYYAHNWFDDNNSHAVMGIDGIIGLEYKIQEIPISISLDLKPALNLIGYTGFYMDFALSLRYVW